MESVPTFQEHPPEPGEYPRNSVGMLGMCSMNKVGAETESDIWVFPKLGSPFPWKFQRRTEPKGGLEGIAVPSQ